MSHHYYSVTRYICSKIVWRKPRPNKSLRFVFNSKMVSLHIDWSVSWNHSVCKDGNVYVTFSCCCHHFWIHRHWPYSSWCNQYLASNKFLQENQQNLRAKIKPTRLNMFNHYRQVTECHGDEMSLCSVVSHYGRDIWHMSESLSPFGAHAPPATCLCQDGE